MAGIDWEGRAAAAIDIARRAGALALEHFTARAPLAVEHKGGARRYDIVSAADRAVEARIRAEIVARFPDDAILGEEEAARAGSSGCTWVVDPIDGTDCFVNRLPAWCVSVAVVGDGDLQAGAVFDPLHGELFHARRGGGAWLDGARLRVSEVSELHRGVVGIGVSHRVDPRPTLDAMERLLAAGGMYQRNGSGALMLAYVADARLIGYFEHHINAWDALAGIALVREAGGWTSDFLAGEGLTRGNPLLACAPGVREALARICPPA